MSKVMEHRLRASIAILLEAKLPSLKTRRSALSLSHLYKIINKTQHYPDAVPRAKTSAYLHALFLPKDSSAVEFIARGRNKFNCMSVVGFKRHLKESDFYS